MSSSLTRLRRCIPWDAIGAVYRGHQLVVAGDQKQLPPSTFFDRMVNNDHDSEDAADLGTFERVLDVLCSIGLPRKGLRDMTAVSANRSSRSRIIITMTTIS